MRVDPDYPHPDRRSARSTTRPARCSPQWMVEQVGDDDELLAKVVPDYVCLGKRTLQDNGSWLGGARPATTSSWSPTRSPRSCPTGVAHGADGDDVPRGRRASSTPPASTPTGTCGRWTSSAATASMLGEQWGDRPDRVPRHHRAELPEPVLPLRARHEPRPRRQPDLPLRVPGPLRDGLPRPQLLGGRARRRSSAARRCTTSTTSDSRPSSTRWSGPTRRSGLSWYRNEEGRDLHPLARGASSTTGPGPASPTSPTSCSRPEPAPEL